MRDSKLTLMLIGLLGGALLPAGCFITTESDEYTESDGDVNTTNPTGPTSSNPCEVGAPGCPCTNSGTCDPGLQCVENTSIGASWCLLPDCTGSLGCECTMGGTCDTGLLCADIGSEPGICVDDDPCLDVDIGTEGCQCTQGGGCDAGLGCVSDLCVDLPDGTSGTTDATESTTTSDGDSSSTTSGADESSSGTVDTSGGASPTTGAAATTGT